MIYRAIVLCFGEHRSELKSERVGLDSCAATLAVRWSQIQEFRECRAALLVEF